MEMEVTILDILRFIVAGAEVFGGDEKNILSMPLIVFNEETKSLDFVRGVTVNGDTIQLTVCEDKENK